MTQQILNPLSVAPNDGLGDTPNAYTKKINDNTTELYSKTATNAAAIAANAASITGFTKTFWFYDNDTATASTPITHAGGASDTYLTNNAVGSDTTSYNPDSNDVLWDPATNKFDFSSLKIGDIVDFRVDLFVNNAAAQEIDLIMSLGEGVGAYELPVGHKYYKTAATGTPVVFSFQVFIGGESTRTGSARFRLSSAAAASVTVRGWLTRATVV